MSIKIVFLDRLSIREDIAIRRPDFAHEWVSFNVSLPEQVVERCGDADIVITNKVPLHKEVIESLRRLKMVAVAATGVDRIDVGACHGRGVIVSNIRNYALSAVPEYVISVVLALRRQLLQYRQEVIRGRWQAEDDFCFFDKPIHDVKGALLGIIGYGALGQATARMAHGLGMRVQYYSPSPRDKDFSEPVELDYLLRTSDVISCHCPLNAQTENLIDGHAFARMKPSAIFVNTARGAIVDEQALAEVLMNNKIAGAGIDVLPEEPPAADSPVMQLAGRTNVILTPHIAWASQQAMQLLADQLIDNIEAFIRGSPDNVVRFRQPAGSAGRFSA